MYVGTTSIAFNRANAALTLAGITLTTPSIAAAGWANANHTHAGSTTGGLITLGTGTTGNYVATAVAGGGIDVSGATGNVTISVEDSSASNKGAVIVAGGTGISVGYSSGTATVTGHTKYALTEDLASSEITAIQNIGAETITATQWGYLGAASGAITNTNTTYLGGTNLTLSGTTFNVDDAFLKNDASDTTSGTITAAGFTTTATGSIAHIKASDEISGSISQAIQAGITTMANLTTVGTIGSGTWQGTAINQTYLVGQSGTNTGDTSITDSTSTTSSTTRGSATGVKAAYDRGSTGVTNAATAQTTANAALPKAGGAMTGAITTNSTFDGVDIAVRDAILTSTTTTAGAALPKAGGDLTGTLNTNREIFFTGGGFGSGDIGIKLSTTHLQIGEWGGVPGDIEFYTDDNLQWTIDDSGNFVSTHARIQTGTGTASSPAIQFASANDGFYHLALGDVGINVLVNNVQEFLFKDGGDFHADGDVVAYSTTTDSDKRLKTNITNISSSLDKVKKLRPVEFDWLVDRDKHEYGLIAQEVEEVLPMLVSEHNVLGDTKKFLKELDGTEVSKTVDYPKLTVLLVDAMKEQQEQIDELKSELKELKNGST
jgi:hypothetical protein